MVSETDSVAKSKPPSKAFRTLLVLLASAGFGAVIGALTVVSLGRHRARVLLPSSPGLLLLSIVPIWFVVILVHELGHVLGGWLCGHRLHMLVIGPLRITRDLRGFRVEFNRTFALSGGLAVCLPTRLDHFVRERMVVVALGPLASVMLALVCGFAAWRLSYLRSWPVDVLAVTGLFSALISCLSLIPNRAGGFPSDGAQLLGLLRGNANSEKLTMIMLIQTQSMSGTRPRNWQEELLARATTLKSKQPFYDAAAALMAYYHYADRQQLELAQNYLEKAVSNFDDLPMGFRQGFALEASYFWAFHRQDLTKATQWLDRGRGGMVEPSTRARVEAAVLLLQGQTQPALEKIRQSRAQLASSIDRGGAQLEYDMLDAMEASLAGQVTLT